MPEHPDKFITYELFKKIMHECNERGFEQGFQLGRSFARLCDSDDDPNTWTNCRGEKCTITEIDLKREASKKKRRWFGPWFDRADIIP